jgi:nucleoside-diphosphate-sugar epimerase
MAFALRWLQQHGCTRVVYWSATSVHGAAGGAEVHAGSPVQPDTARGRARAAHEADCRSLAASLGIAVDLVRLPGIHGPGRTVLERIRRGDYPLVDGGFMWSNRIHVADIASATLHILGSTPGGQDWLASDGTPFQVIEMVTWVCSTWALPMPPSCRLDDLPDSVADFWRGDRRCNPERLLQTGWRPAFPNYRVAMLDAWRQEGRVLPADALGPG